MMARFILVRIRFMPRPPRAVQRGPDRNDSRKARKLRTEPADPLPGPGLPISAVGGRRVVPGRGAEPDAQCRRPVVHVELRVNALQVVLDGLLGQPGPAAAP